MTSASLYGPEAMAFFEQLKQQDPLNGVCCDCGAHNPLWASLSYGSYFCLECSGVHRSIGVHISFVRSLNMDSWNEQQQSRMRAGGNTKLRDYLRACGMPNEYTLRGGPCVRDKYHTESAAAYRTHIEKVARGEPSTLTPIPFEVAAPPAVAPGGGGGGGSDRNSGRKMEAFGSGPVDEYDGNSGLDSLMSCATIAAVEPAVPSSVAHGRPSVHSCAMGCHGWQLSALCRRRRWT